MERRNDIMMEQMETILNITGYMMVGLIYGIPVLCGLYGVISYKAIKRRGGTPKVPCFFYRILYITIFTCFLLVIQDIVNKWTHPAVLYSIVCLIFYSVCSILHAVIISKDDSMG